jgi:hypothetical protein
MGTESKADPLPIGKVQTFSFNNCPPTKAAPPNKSTKRRPLPITRIRFFMEFTQYQEFEQLFSDRCTGYFAIKAGVV